MRVVARAARHLAFAHRHVRDGAFGLGHLQPVARRADLGLGRLDQLPLRRLRAVHAVTRRAREVAGGVRAALPPRVCAAVVTGEACLADLRRLHLLELLMCPLASSSTCAWPGRGSSRTRWGRRRSRILRLPVLRAFEGGLLIGVARDAGIAPDIAGGGAVACAGAVCVGDAAVCWRCLCRRGRRREPTGDDRRPIESTTTTSRGIGYLNRSRSMADLPWRLCARRGITVLVRREFQVPASALPGGARNR